MPGERTTWPAAYVYDGITTFWENARAGLKVSTDVFRTVVTKENTSRVTIAEEKMLHEPVTVTRASLTTHNSKAGDRIKQLSGAAGFYVIGTAYAVDPLDADYWSGVAVANLHSDKVCFTPFTYRFTHLFSTFHCNSFVFSSFYFILRFI